MKLAADHRDVVNAIIADAHREGARSGDIAAEIVDAIEDLERFGQDWSPAFLRELAIKGALKLASDWRRSQSTVTKTEGGTTVALPTFAGIRDAEGHHVQVRLASMDAAQLRAHRERLSAQRNTLSKDVQYVTDLLNILAANPSLRTAGEAEALRAAERAA